MVDILSDFTQADPLSVEMFRIVADHNVLQFNLPTVRKRPLNERLRRGGSKRRLGLEAPNYSVVGILESVLKETTLTPSRSDMIGALILAGLALQPSELLSSRANRLWNGTLHPAVHLWLQTSGSSSKRPNA